MGIKRSLPQDQTIAFVNHPEVFRIEKPLLETNMLQCQSGPLPDAQTRTKIVPVEYEVEQVPAEKGASVSSVSTRANNGQGDQGHPENSQRSPHAQDKWSQPPLRSDLLPAPHPPLYEASPYLDQAAPFFDIRSMHKLVPPTFHFPFTTVMVEPGCRAVEAMLHGAVESEFAKFDRMQLCQLITLTRHGLLVW